MGVWGVLCVYVKMGGELLGWDVEYGEQCRGRCLLTTTTFNFFPSMVSGPVGVWNKKYFNNTLLKNWGGRAFHNISSSRFSRNEPQQDTCTTHSADGWDAVEILSDSQASSCRIRIRGTFSFRPLGTKIGPHSGSEG